MTSAPTAPSGSLSAASRTQAINEALPFVATYFSRGRMTVFEQSLATRRATKTVVGDRIGAALLFRARLQNATELVKILEQIAEAPSFDYRIAPETSVGQVRGTLDVGRWATLRARSEVPRQYPVHASRRDPVTVENRLAFLAVGDVIHDLDSLTAALQLTPRHSEHRRAAAVRDRLLTLRARMARGAPALARRDRSNLTKLAEVTQTRLQRQRISNSEAYELLLEWVRKNLLAAPTMRRGVGSTEAAFYGTEFDTTLFEIWLLSRLSDALTRRLGTPKRSRRDFDPSRRTLHVGVWLFGVARLSLTFQPSLSALTGADNRWSNDKQKPLRGFPDIGIVIAGGTIKRQVFLVDAKLRQRRSSDLSGEIYKLLGYFANDGTLKINSGAIVYHAPGGHVGATREHTHWRTWTAENGGRIAALGIEPTDINGTTTAMDTLVAMALDMPASDWVHDGRPADSVEDLQQRVAVEQLSARLIRESSTNKNPAEGQLVDLLHGRWRAMPDRVKTALVAAVHFGQIASEGEDTSGPVLGLSASIEILLRSSLVEPAAARAKIDVPAVLTFGALLHHVDVALALNGNATTSKLPHPLASAIDGYLTLRNLDRSVLAAITSETRTLVRNARNPAAHGVFTSKAAWTYWFRKLLLPDGLLCRTFDAVEGSAGRTPNQLD